MSEMTYLHCKCAVKTHNFLLKSCKFHARNIEEEKIFINTCEPVRLNTMWIFQTIINAFFSQILQMFGCGAVAQVILSEGSHGLFLTVNLAFGFSATLGILICGQVSGKQTLLKLHSKPLLCMGRKQDVRFIKDSSWMTLFISVFRGSFKSSCYICSLPLGKRKMEKVPSLFLLPNIGIIPGCCNYLCWIPR